jgi:hypothetical protein
MGAFRLLRLDASGNKEGIIEKRGESFKKTTKSAKKSALRAAT